MLDEVDYQSAGASPLQFARHYESSDPLSSQIGNRWHHNYDANLTIFPANNFAALRLGDGSLYYFYPVSSGSTTWKSSANVKGTLTQTASGWQYQDRNNVLYNFDANGNLLSRAQPSGITESMSYDSNGNLLQVADNFGHTLQFTYGITINNVPMLTQLTLPDGQTISYAYDNSTTNSGALLSVTYQDGKVRQYQYQSGSGTTSSIINQRTQENGAQSFWQYGASNGATAFMPIANYLVGPAGNVDNYTISYQQTSGILTNATITNPLGIQRSYAFQSSQQGQNLPISETSPLAGAGSAQQSYDQNGNVISYTDYNGNLTCYAYDMTRNLETARVEGLPGSSNCATALAATSLTPPARRVTTQWHPSYLLKTLIAEPKRITTLSYDASGNLLSKSVQATTDATGASGAAASASGPAQVVSYTYNAVGQVLTASGPRTDVTNVTSYTYDSAGNLASITNPAGQTTTLSDYDANGRVGLITDPNGATTTLGYTVRGWLSSKVVTAGNVVQSTAYSYDGIGNLLQTTNPDNSTLTYSYDTANRLTAVTDSFGNSINYTLDAMDQRIGETMAGPGGATVRQISRVFDQANRLQQVTGAAQ